MTRKVSDAVQKYLEAIQKLQEAAKGQGGQGS